MRKHRQQMQLSEIAAIENRVREISPYLDPHTTARMFEKGISLDEITAAVRQGVAIEIHNEADELRVVVRHDYGKKRNRVGVVVVIGIETGNIATAWKNAGDDNHATLNISKYKWNVDVTALLSAL